MQLLQKRGSSQRIKFLSAFRHCILLGYLLSLNRKLFQIDRQTERCAECVNWNHHIYQFPSPGAGLELSSRQVLRECQEYGFWSPSPIIPHLFQCLILFLNSLPRCFWECLTGQCRDAGVPVAETAKQDWRNRSIWCEDDCGFQGFYPLTCREHSVLLALRYH